jgi:exopolysaccharide production protein ExoZ
MAVRQQTFPLVQSLRAVAALAVALHHVTHDALSVALSDPSLATRIGDAMPWEAGVDIFFVISGFVMLHASEALFRRGLVGIRVFMARRVARIVPLYWATTTLFLVIVALAPHSISASLGGVGYILRSYAFIPDARPDGLVQPAYGLGWTLNYEMFFYVSFALCLWMPRRIAIIALTACLGGAVIAGIVARPTSDIASVWTSQIILEFLLGVWIRFLLPRIGTVPVALRLALVVAAVFVFRANYLADGAPRILAWGIPAALLVLAAVTGREKPRSRWMSLWIGLGDASYALYLLHPFVMRAGSLLWRHVGMNTAGATLVYIGLSLVLSCVVARLVNVGLEVPMTRQVRRWLEPTSPIGGRAAVPLVGSA